ncbi:MAG TPA: 3'(2'),5'-bisphosphate nucleotidase CysQ [Roseiarcus sp.]|nr:3'(2'),5'-bisphosphate nucleotidase CysQ [Roseiarcus sp.]
MSSVLRDPTPFALDQGTRDEIALFLAGAALAAGPAVMEEYERGCEVAAKKDGSPVTSADHRAEAIICERLTSMVPMPPVCAEEAMAAGAEPGVAERFLLVDPLDGTREFLAGNGEFTINVALIERGAPVAGAVYAPAIGRLWVGGDTAFVSEARPGAPLPGEGSRRPIRTRRAPLSLVALASRSHLDPQSESFLKGLPIGETRFAGSSLKFCLIAEGEGDVYPRFAPTMEWDTAAGDAVLRAAGGAVLDPSGRPLSYGKVESGLRNGPFIAWGDATAARRFGY